MSLDWQAPQRYSIVFMHNIYSLMSFESRSSRRCFLISAVSRLEFILSSSEADLGLVA